jgi:hypothetical protein
MTDVRGSNLGTAGTYFKIYFGYTGTFFKTAQNIQTRILDKRSNSNKNDSLILQNITYDGQAIPGRWPL